MEHLAHGPADRRVSPSSTDDLDSADVADTLVAHGVDSRVGAEQSSSEDLHPNTRGPKGGPPSVSTDTDREVAALKVQVGELAGMLRAFMAQQSLATPPSLSAASSSPEESSAQRTKRSMESERNLAAGLVPDFDALFSLAG